MSHRKEKMNVENPLQKNLLIEEESNGVYAVKKIQKIPHLTSDELSHLYYKYVGGNPAVSNNLMNNEECKDFFVEDNLDINISELESFSTELLKNESCEEKPTSQATSTIFEHSLSGGIDEKKDFFISGQAPEDISGFDGFQVNTSNILNLNYSDMKPVDEPSLEKLFSGLSQISQATTLSIASSDDIECNVMYQNLKETAVLEERIMPVIYQSDSNVFVVE